MSGTKGKSGKIHTAADRKARRRAAQAGGMAKRNRSAGHSAPDDVADTAHPGPRPFPVDNWMDLKDDYAVRLADVKVATALVELDEAKVKRDLARGKLKTRDEFRESITAIVEEIVSRLSILVDAAVETHPPENQPRIRHLMEAAAYKLRDEVRARLKEQTA